MPTIEEVQTWQGQTAHGRDGEKLGTVEDIYLDDQTGEPEWVAIKTGLFGAKLSFAPLAEATRSGDGVQLPYGKDQVKDAPSVDADGQLSQDEEAALYRHYGLEYSEAPSDCRRSRCCSACAWARSLPACASCLTWSLLRWPASYASLSIRPATSRPPRPNARAPASASMPRSAA